MENVPAGRNLANLSAILERLHAYDALCSVEFVNFFNIFEVFDDRDKLAVLLDQFGVHEPPVYLPSFYLCDGSSILQLISP